MPLPLEDGGEVITNSTNQMLDVVNNKKQRKGNRRHNNNNNNNNSNNNNNHRNKNKNNNRNNNNNNNNNNQNDGALSEDTNPASVITVFNRTGTINHKLRKNDAVKVIQTPNGKVGIVYQSTKTASNKQDNFPMESQWDDVYTQHQSNHYVNRNANDVKMLPPTGDGDQQPINKIIPVLTSDGKIALVYRGDSSRYNNEHNINGSSNSVGYNKKYEPLTNYSSSIMTTLNNNDNNNIKQKNDSINLSVGDSKLHQEQQSNLLINRLDEFLASVTNKVKHIEEVVEEELGIIGDSVAVTTSTESSSSTLTSTTEVTSTTTTTTTEQPIIQGDFNNGNGQNHQNPLLINRPLSEVLGIKKKTYFHHPDRESSTMENPTQPTQPWDERRTTARIERIHTTLNSMPTMDTNTIHEEFDLENPEMINIAIIPGFDSEMEERLFGKNKDNRSYPSAGGSSSGMPIHCAMQAMIALSLMVAAFGMLGAYYKVHIVNQIRVMYW